MRGGGGIAKPAVLVVDDEAKILDILRSYLERSGYQALTAQSGREGLAVLERNHVSLLLLDLMLPDIPGEEICRRIREESDHPGLPIIMMTAKIEERDIIRGLNMGADDYVAKPFSPRELMARVAAALRRAGASGAAGSSGSGGREGRGEAHRSEGQWSEGPRSEKLRLEKPRLEKPRLEKPVLISDALRVDMENRRVSMDGADLPLTPNEYRILALLMSRPQKIFTRDEIIENIKDNDYDGFDRTIDSHIKNLRQKIRDDPKSPKYIVTVYGMGYRFGGVVQ
jgi:DNA-binding response OmpR family regulator